jgi:hypothetical protein
MAQELNIEQKLADLLDTRDFHPETTGKDGRPSDTDESKVFTFDYVSQSGKNYGTMVIVLGSKDNPTEMLIMYGDNLGKTMESPEDRDDFFNFQQQLMALAHRNRWTGTMMDISKLHQVQASLKALTEGLFEGYYGNKRTSYSGEPTEARLVINHNRVLGENDKRYRYVESLFIETADRERFKLQFTNLAGGRAMLEHVRQGGKPYDIRGSHINNMVTEMKVLNRFNRASQGRVMEGVTQEITEQAHLYYQSLRESVKRMGTPRGYAHYFESWHPAEIGEQEGLVEDIKTMFIEQTLDSRIEEALPLLARIQQQGNAMKEADIFESWINRLAEGTWATPKKPEQLNKLKELMSKELIVGPDGTNATEQLYSLVGDDILFDRIDELAADTNGKANVWDDSVVQARLQELGIDTSTIGQPDDAEPTGTEPGIQPEQPVAPTQDMPQEPPMAPISEADDIATFESLNAMRKAAGLPVVESVLTDSTGHTLDHILKRFSREVKDFKDGGEMHDDLYHALYDYYFEDMPYDVKKNQNGQDSYEWLSDRLVDELGINEGMLDEVDFDSLNQMASHAVNVLGQGGAGTAAAATGAALGGLVGKGIEKTANYFQKKKQDKAYDNLKKQAANESSCNMTMEGEYCPEHGLMECGGMYEGWKSELAGGTLGGVGGTVAGSALGALATGSPIGAAIGGVVGGAAGGTAGQMAGRELTKEEQLNEIAPLLAAGARAVIPLLSKVGPALGRMASGAGKAVTGKTAAGIGRGTADVAKSAAQSAAQNADKIGIGLGAYQAITDVANNTMGGVGEVYRDVGKAAGAITQSVGNAIDGKTIAELASTAVKYSIPIGIILAVLYGGKKLIDQVMDEGLVGGAIGTALGGPVGGMIGSAMIGNAVGEGHDDPINSNSAITGAYYESKSDDALLARIKSLALIK